jgi:hypothetical protein
MNVKLTSFARGQSGLLCRRQIRVALLLWFLAPLLCDAAENRPRIIEYGIYQGAPEKTIKSSEAGTGDVELGGSIKLVKKTEKVPAVLGTKFGLKFYLPVELRRNGIILKYVFLVPGLKDPRTGKIQERIEVPGKYDGGADGIAYVFYDFTDQWELVPGKWTFQVFHDDEKLIEKTFTVVKAN